MRRILFGVAVVVIMVARAPAASACLCSPTVVVGTVHPADQSSGVPLNAQLLVVTDGWEGPIELWHDGQPVSITPVQSWERVYGSPRNETWRLLRPLLLLPDTEYELTIAGVVWSTFSTGTSADETPPLFAGLGSAEGAIVPGSGSTCWNTNPLHRLELFYDDPPADVAYRVVRLRVAGREPFFEVPVTERPGESPYVSGRILETSYCSPTAPELVTGETYCATLTAYDLAGNAAGADTERCFTALMCEPTESDGTFNPTCVEAQPSSGGCRASTDRSIGGAVFLLVLMGLSMRWRLLVRCERCTSLLRQS